jgi:asparagine synthase (glutamine-hydrolysing)
MCGFVGISNSRTTGLLPRMLGAVAHRGPDDWGFWKNDHHAFGHARLSIIDVEGGSQPMGDPASGRTVVFNGEIYNHRQLRQAMGETRFRTHCDTEALLHLAAGAEPPEQWVRRLDGMFAFALTDGPDLVLARDPLGIKPLYTAGWEGGLAFASELKALPAGAQNVREFPAGHVYSRRTGLKRYYDLPAAKPDVTDVQEARRGIRERLEAAVCKRLVADVPVGVFLSGGLDSSLIAALARRHKNPLETFSIGTADSEDRRLALEMARVLDTRHFERVFTLEEAVEVLPEVIYYLESFDCALVRSAVPNFFLAKLAAQHVKVALSGEGADELFAGYEYLKELGPETLHEELRTITRNLHNTNLQRCDRMSMAHGLEVRVPLLDVAVVDYAFRIPVEMKQFGEARQEKWILRKTAESLLPAGICWRPKSKFAIGSGLGSHLAALAEREISDAAFAREQEIADGFLLRSKEELYYYRLFKQIHPRADLVPLVGRSRSV